VLAKAAAVVLLSAALVADVVLEEVADVVAMVCEKY
jgi:hypothetical protein